MCGFGAVGLQETWDEQAGGNAYACGEEWCTQRVEGWESWREEKAGCHLDAVIEVGRLNRDALPVSMPKVSR